MERKWIGLEMLGGPTLDLERFTVEADQMVDRYSMYGTAFRLLADPGTKLRGGDELLQPAADVDLREMFFLDEDRPVHEVRHGSFRLSNASFVGKVTAVAFVAHFRNRLASVLEKLVGKQEQAGWRVACALVEETSADSKAATSMPEMENGINMPWMMVDASKLKAGLGSQVAPAVGSQEQVMTTPPRLERQMRVDLVAWTPGRLPTLARTEHEDAKGGTPWNNYVERRVLSALPFAYRQQRARAEALLERVQKLVTAEDQRLSTPKVALGDESFLALLKAEGVDKVSAMLGITKKAVMKRAESLAKVS